MLSRLVAQRICETILQVNLKIQGVPDTLKCETGKKEVWTPKVVLISELRESKVTYGSEDSGDLSLRDACLGKPRSMNKRSFISSNVDSRWKGDNGKGLKGGHKEGTQKQKVRKLHCAALMHIRHLQKYEYIPENVRKSNSSVEFMEIEIGTIIDEVVDGWHQWKVARMNSKPSSSTSTITEYFGTFFMNFDNSWMVSYGSKLRKKEENFDNRCFESSKPTVEYHESGSQDSNNVETKVRPSSMHRETVAFTMRVKPRRPRWTAAAAAAILCQNIRGQNPTTEKKNLSRGQNLDYDSWMTDVEKIFFETLIFKYVYFGTMIDVTVKKREQRIGTLLPILRTGGFIKFQNFIGRRIHVWGLVALPLPQKLQIFKLGDIRAIRRPQADCSTKNVELRKDSLH